MKKIFLKKRVGCPLGEYIVLLQDIDSLDLQYFMRQFRAKSEGIRETFKSGFEATKAAVFCEFYFSSTL